LDFRFATFALLLSLRCFGREKVRDKNFLAFFLKKVRVKFGTYYRKVVPLHRKQKNKPIKTRRQRKTAAKKK
jgi:hypothetical protein